MCGIFAAINSNLTEKELTDWSSKVSHRGPDNFDFVNLDKKVFLGFNRLRINGLDMQSDQPFVLNGVCLIANAEVFNHKELEEKYDLKVKTNSDCEVILHLYLKIGFEAMIKELDAEFAIVLYDSNKDVVFAARDHLGIRGMYFGEQGNSTYVASEAKALTFCNVVQQFPPREFWRSDTKGFTKYYHLNFEYHQNQNEENHLDNISKILKRSVKKRMMSDRNIGCLLSGGLDSSLISAIVAKESGNPKEVQTFSIGLDGSPDLIAAQAVADHIGTTHHSIIATEEDFLRALKDTIYICGSYDVTTIRASVGHQLVSNWIKKNSDVKVLFSGETADEFGSYLYFQNAPSEEDFQKEAVRLLEDIHYFDMLRGDRSVSSAGLEARVPFADKEFVEYYMGIEAKQRMFNSEKMEKYLIRKAFEKEKLLPDSVLWRRKNGFSDSVSNKSKSWSTIIQEYIDTQISDEEFNSEQSNYNYLPPVSKESYYFRKVFCEYYGQSFEKLVPYQWLPKWCGNIIDPSARSLTIYEAD